jgi:hypothetical protein
MDSTTFPSQPVSLLGSIRAGKPIPGKDVGREQDAEDRKILLSAMPDNAQLRSYSLEVIMPGSHFYVRREHYAYIQELHLALDKAVTDIVERWYSDEKAGFPARMPLSENEDKLLRVSGHA